jgi:hypothetical protein
VKAYLEIPLPKICHECIAFNYWSHSCSATGSYVGTNLYGRSFDCPIKFIDEAAEKEKK